MERKSETKEKARYIRSKRGREKGIQKTKRIHVRKMSEDKQQRQQEKCTKGERQETTRQHNRKSKYNKKGETNKDPKRNSQQRTERKGKG